MVSPWWMCDQVKRPFAKEETRGLVNQSDFMQKQKINFLQIEHVQGWISDDLDAQIELNFPRF